MKPKDQENVDTITDTSEDIVANNGNVINIEDESSRKDKPACNGMIKEMNTGKDGQYFDTHTCQDFSGLF